jgi:beta-RFAP synthase
MMARMLPRFPGAADFMITTGARLHFGFLSCPPGSEAPAAAADEEQHDSPTSARHYAGVGLMLDAPGFVVTFARGREDSVEFWLNSGEKPPVRGWTSAETVDCEELRGLLLRLVIRYRRSCSPQGQPPPCRLGIAGTIPRHRGLGSGTQLAMAVAHGLAILAGQTRCDVVALATRVGRGRRSAVGIHGYARGGLLLDGGKPSDDEIGPLVARLEVPADWRFLLVAPPESAGLSGTDELSALSRLPRMSARMTERLCRLALLEILPAAAEADCDRFGEAIYEFGHEVGGYFACVQGGHYADARMAALVETVRGWGVRGATQTSWGPTIAICCPNAAAADSLRTRIARDARFHDCPTFIAAPLNQGAAVER